MSFSLNGGNAMDVLWGIVAAVGHAIEQVLFYVETHHWIFGFFAGGYIFYLHDRSLHARFDALDKRIDEIRKRLAAEYWGLFRHEPYGRLPNPRGPPPRRRLLTSR